MKLKGICLIAAAVLSIGTASLAKDKGTLTKFPNWGVITVPNDIFFHPSFPLQINHRRCHDLIVRKTLRFIDDINIQAESAEGAV